MNILLENKLFLYSLTSVAILINLSQIATIELKFIKKYLAYILKYILAFIILGIVTINVIGDKKDSIILETINLFYDNYTFIIVSFLAFYIIDKYTESKINSNYLKYIIYIISLLIYSSTVLKKQAIIIIFGILWLSVFKLVRYKKDIQNKYENLYYSMGKKTYIFYLLIGAILGNCMILSIYNKSNYELILIFITYNVIVICKNRIQNNENKEHIISSALSDGEINSKDKLFNTRKKELEYILNYFRTEIKEINEPYSVSISGKWGEGKSSFVNVLKEELKTDYIVFKIQPMVTDTRDGIIKYFSNQLEKSFRYYGLMIGDSGSIEDYFKSVLKLIDSNNKLSIGELINKDNVENLDLRDKKIELQNDINELYTQTNKKILMVVDDFDRVDDEVRYSILTFMKEIINFKYLDSIVLLDYSTIESNRGSKNITYEFLEKFINKRFELNRLDSEEIIDFYKEELSKSLDIDENNKLRYVINDTLINLEVHLNDIKTDIEKAIESNNSKLKELEQKNSNDKDDYSIEWKKVTIKNVESLKEKINRSLSNTRKIKRLIRELKDKIDYVNYLYSMFNDIDIEKLIGNIEIKKIILIISLIKVLYESEFDNILKSKDFYKYITDEHNENENDYQEVKELIYCTIFNDSSKLAHNYGIGLSDSKAIDFINNIFININTPKDMFDFRQEEERLLDIIDSKPVNFGNNKSVYENIKDLYDKVQFSNIKHKMKDISLYISKELKSGNIELDNAVQLIKTNRSFGGVVQLNKEYIKSLSNYLKEKSIIYKEISHKQRDEYVLKMSIQEVINCNKEYIAFILSYRLLAEQGNLYYRIKSELEERNSIIEINEYVKTFYEDLDLGTSASELDKFIYWASISKMYNDEVDYNKVNKIIIEMVDILRDLEFIKESVINSEIDSYKPRDSYIGVGDCKLVNELEIIKSYIRNKNISNDQRYDLFAGFKRIICRFADTIESNNIIIENIEFINSIYSTMYDDIEFQNIIEERKWLELSLEILEIKRKQNTLNIINE